MFLLQESKNLLIKIGENCFSYLLTMRTIFLFFFFLINFIVYNDRQTSTQMQAKIYKNKFVACKYGWNNSLKIFV